MSCWFELGFCLLGKLENGQLISKLSFVGAWKNKSLSQPLVSDRLF